MNGHLRRCLLPVLLFAALLTLGFGCDDDDDVTQPGDEYNPNIDPANFVAEIDNPYLPLIPGTLMIYEGESEGESEVDSVEVTDETKVILGVTCIVVHDRVYADNELAEDTFDWYAQDSEGNVWYFGEDTREYEDGEVVSTEGSWEAGVDGAQPGIVMLGTPVVGAVYRQEYLEGEAEDWAQVSGIDQTVTIDLGTFIDCVRTREWTPLEPGIEANKYHAPGIGLILDEHVQGPDERFELVEITGVD